MRTVRALIERFGPTELPILVVGPTGTGKELVAQHVHYRSGRAGDLMDVDCGAIAGTLLEATLFGHAPRAFTGARDGRAGLIEAAGNGTLFLDELGSIPLDAQRVFLRVLDTRRLRRIGETAQRAVNFRLIAAAQEDIEEKVERGLFRRDLYQRVAAVVIRLPSLAERPEDVLVLATHFAAMQGRLLEPGAATVLLSQRWPGNVRELRQVIERAGYLVGNGTLPETALQEALTPGWSSLDSAASPPSLSAERETLVALCRARAWNLSATARGLGVSRSTLYRRLARAGLSAPAIRVQT